MLNFSKLSICLALLLTVSFYAGAQTGNYEVIYQDTFEAPLAAPWASAVTTWDATEFVSPSHSMKYTQTSLTTNSLLGPSITAVPGQSCYGAVMLKTAGLSAGTKGARIAVEGYTSAGSWIGGAYSPFFRGTDWTLVKTPPYTIPPNAAKIKVSLYIEKGYTGTAWFDDFKFYQVPAKPLASKLITPSYRGLLMDNEYDRIEIAAKLIANAAQYYTRVDLVDANDQTIGTVTSAAGVSPFNASFPAADLAPGSYKLIARAFDKVTNAPVDTNQYVIRKLAPSEAKPKNYVDKYGRLIVDGQPYFTLGTYNGHLTDDVIEKHRNSPFNTVLSYQYLTTSARLDKVSNAGLKTLFSLKNFYNGLGSFNGSETDSIAKYVNLGKSHPAILGWYTNDESNIGLFKKNMLAHQAGVEALDYDHPTYSVDLTLPSGEFFSKATDIFGTDYYPIYGKPGDWTSNPGEWTKFVKTELPHRAPMTVIQNFRWGTNKQPDVREMRSMSWQSIAEGATGLMYYSYFNMTDGSSTIPFDTLWKNLKTVGQEVKDLAPVILSVEETPAVDIANGGTWMNWTVRKFNNKIYVIAANAKKAAFQNVSFSLANASSVTVLNENRTIALNGNTFTDSFDTLAVHIYEVNTNIAPSVAITSPVENASFDALANFTISADATDVDGSVSKVEFFMGAEKLGEDLTAPYSLDLTNLPTGSYALTAKATDNSGAVTTSGLIDLNVVCPAVQVNIADVYAMNPAVDQKNTIYLGYGPTSLTVTASATGSQGYTYSWNTGEQTQSLSVSQAGTYTVTVTYAGGCQSSDSITIDTLDVRCGNNSDKVMICHNNKAICVASDAVQSHLDHGDKLGSCGAGARMAVPVNEINEVDSKFKVAAYPNPVSERLYIAVPKLEANAMALVCNVRGELVRSVRFTSEKQEISLKGLMPGAYFVNIRNGHQTITKKIVKY